MDLGGVAEVSSAEGCGHLLEVLPDALNLLPIRWVVGDDGLQAAVPRSARGGSMPPTVSDIPDVVGSHTVMGYRYLPHPANVAGQ
jgi:hypothetical protein